MKNFAIATAMILLFSMQGLAQKDVSKSEISPERKAEIMSEALSEKIKLTDIQKKKVEGLMLENQKRKEALKRANKLRRQEFNSSLEAILTPEQRLAYDKMIEERKREKAQKKK